MKTITVYLKCIGLLLISFLFCTCSKEELSVYDIPSDELKVNFYDLRERTIELNSSEIAQNILSIDDYSLLLTKANGMFDDLQEGDVIISAYNDPGEKVVFVKVLSMEDRGSEIYVETQQATLLDAYSNYYFSSKNSETIKLRNNPGLEFVSRKASSFINSAIDSAFKALNINYINVNAEFGVTGTLDFDAEHPHNVYAEIKAPNRKSDLVDSLKNTLSTSDINNNEIHDDVENYFFESSNATTIVNKFGFVQFIFEDFGISKFSTEAVIGGFDSSLKNSSASKIEAKFLDLEAFSHDTTPQNSSTLDLKYIKLYTDGIFSVSAVIEPIVEFMAAAYVYASAELTFPKAVTLKIGHIGVREGDSSFSVNVENGSKENPASFPNIAPLFADPSLTLALGVKGNINKALGLLVGAALSIGEPTTVGISGGCFIAVKAYSKINATAALVIEDLPNNSNPFQIAGKLCLDFGLDYDVGAFGDFEFFGSKAVDAYDFKWTVPKGIFGFKPLSFWSLVPPSSENGVTIDAKDGLCFMADNSCGDIVTEDFTLDTQNKTLKCKIKNDKLANNQYSIVFSNDATEVLTITDSNLKFNGNTATISLNDSDLNKIQTPLLNNNLKIQVKASTGTNFCRFDIPNDELSYIDCVQTFNTSGPIKYEEAGSFLKDYDWHNNFLIYNDQCIQPNGFFSYENGKKINRNKAYFWINDPKNEFNAIEVRFSYENGETIPFITAVTLNPDNLLFIIDEQ